MKTKSVKKIAMIAVALLVFTAFVYSMFGVQKRPVPQVAVYRKCDFISIDGATKVVCADDSQWMALELATAESPQATELADVRDSDDTLGQVFGVAPVVAAPVVVDPVAATPAEDTSILVRYSHYWPPLGPPNCSNFVDGDYHCFRC